MSRRPVITLHAIRRFAERVMGVAILSNSDEAAVVELRTVHGVDTADIERELAALVRRGVAAGAPIVLFGGARYVLKGRQLVTILIPLRRRRRRRIDRRPDYHYALQALE